MPSKGPKKRTRERKCLCDCVSVCLGVCTRSERERERVKAEVRQLRASMTYSLRRREKNFSSRDIASNEFVFYLARQLKLMLK